MPPAYVQSDAVQAADTVGFRRFPYLSQADAAPLRRDGHVYTQPEKPAGFGMSVKRTGASPSYQGHPLPNGASLMGLPLA